MANLHNHKIERTMNMNNNPINEPNEPDYANAHYVAFDKMAEENRLSGQLNCCDYLLEFHRELGEDPASSSLELLRVLNSMPTIRSDVAEMDLLAQAFERSHLQIPAGLYDLPLFWGRAIREMMLKTHWPEHENCKIEDVFGWSAVFRFGAFLHICFDSPYPPNQGHWCEIGSLIHELHTRLEPGPYTAEGRLCEFLV
jgi:hypothetical protein